MKFCLEKIETFFSNSSNLNFKEKAIALKVEEGAIEKMVVQAYTNKKSTIKTKIKALQQKLKCFELAFDYVDDYEHMKWLCRLADLYLSLEDDESLKEAYRLSQEAALKCREDHAEKIEPMLRQVKALMMMDNLPEKANLTSLMNELHNIVKFHLGDEHPAQIKILEQFGDMYNFFKKDLLTINFYSFASRLAKAHLGVDHLVRMRLLKKMASIHLSMESFEEAFICMLDVIEIMKTKKLEHSICMASILNDTLRLAIDLGSYDQVVRIGCYGQKIMIKCLEDWEGFELPLAERSEEFKAMLEYYYDNCKWIRKICFKKHKSFKFFREFCNDFHKIFMRDVEKYKANFMYNRLSGDYANRPSVYRRLIKCFCLLATLLLDAKEKLYLTCILDRFYFNTLRNEEDVHRKMIRAACIADTIKQCEAIFKGPYEVLKRHLQFLMDQRLRLLEIMDHNRFKDVIYFHEIGDRGLKERLTQFRSFISLCGFSNFKNLLLENEN